MYDLTHWSRVTNTCVNKETNIFSDYGLSPNRRQAIIWTNARILLIGTNFRGILIVIHTFSKRKLIKKCRLENGGHFVWASMCWNAWLIVDTAHVLLEAIILTIQCPYNAAQYTTEVYEPRQWQLLESWNISYSRNTPHILPPFANWPCYTETEMS